MNTVGIQKNNTMKYIIIGSIIFVILIIIIMIPLIIYFINKNIATRKEKCLNEGKYWDVNSKKCLTEEEICENDGNFWVEEKCLTPKEKCENDGEFWVEEDKKCLDEGEKCEYDGNLWDPEWEGGLCYDDPELHPGYLLALEAQQCRDSGKVWLEEERKCITLTEASKDFCLEKGENYRWFPGGERGICTTQQLIDECENDPNTFFNSEYGVCTDRNQDCQEGEIYYEPNGGCTHMSVICQAEGTNWHEPTNTCYDKPFVSGRYIIFKSGTSTRETIDEFNEIEIYGRDLQGNTIKLEPIDVIIVSADNYNYKNNLIDNNKNTKFTLTSGGLGGVHPEFKVDLGEDKIIDKIILHTSNINNKYYMDIYNNSQDRTTYRNMYWPGYNNDQSSTLNIEKQSKIL